MNKPTLDLVAFSQLVAAIALALTAVFALQAIWTQRKQTRSVILLECLRSYVTIRRLRTDALLQNSPDMCSDYYRAVVDLHWSEFQLWCDKQIDDRIMQAWLDARRRNFAGDELKVTLQNGQTKTIKYQDEWNKLTNEKYFAPTDPFVSFMNQVHDGNIKEVLRKRRQWKRES